MDECEPAPYLEGPHAGAGLFLRDKDFLPRYGPEHLDWASVCVLGGGRPRNRGRAWWAARMDEGLDLSAWDWFPDPDRPTKNLADAVRFAADNGARSFIMNAEKGFRGRPDAARRYGEAARELADRYKLWLGLVSYSITNEYLRDFPWAEFAEVCDFGVPEIYDREGEYDPEYPAKAIQSWYDMGFSRVLPACGVYVRKDGGRGWRWRTDGEVGRHLDLFPEDMEAWIGWPIAGHPPEGTLRGLAR